MSGFIVMGGCNVLVTQVLLALRSAGKYKCTVLGGPATRPLRRSSLCDDHIEIDVAAQDDDKLLRHLRALAAQDSGLVLLPADCASVRTVSRIKDRLPVGLIPIPEVATMDMFDNKWRFFQFCREHDLSVPDTLYIGVKNSLDFVQVTAALGLPFILKPIGEAGSEGVQIVRSEEQFRQEILDNPAYHYRSLIAQRYISGSDVCIDLFAVDGKVRALAFQERVGPTMRFFANEQMQDIAHRLAGASGYTGIMNMDARIEDGSGKVFLLESNPRFWATLTASAGAGLNFVAESIAPCDEAAPVRMLTQGEFHLRHPLIRPASWGALLADRGGHGRLLRAKMMDMRALAGALKSLFAAPLRQMQQMFSKADGGEAYRIQRR